MPDARNYGDGTVPVEQPRGCWVAYYTDRSGFAVFGTEIEALRHAVDTHMQVKFCEWGDVTF